jgi:hypothetical protein
MFPSYTHLILLAIAADGLLTFSTFAADDFLFDESRPACGKVCKLVSETKKLTAVCYGCDCKDMCVPGPSRQGCKHCDTCEGACSPNSCDSRSIPPRCEFCWRDWFACGCARPRTVHVLTKYQAEKKICWYHWEVVDAACCDCVATNNPTAAGKKNSAKSSQRNIFKSAPESAELGDVLPVSEEEWVKLAGILSPPPMQVSPSVVAGPAPPSVDAPPGSVAAPNPATKAPSVAERVQRLFK